MAQLERHLIILNRRSIAWPSRERSRRVAAKGAVRRQLVARRVVGANAGRARSMIARRRSGIASREASCSGAASPEAVVRLARELALGLTTRVPPRRTGFRPTETPAIGYRRRAKAR